VGKFAPMIARNLRPRRCKPRSRWYFDEMVSRIAGKQMSLWRAVDDEGEVLEVLIQRRRNKAAAGKLIRKLLRKQGFAPTCVTTDKLRSYGAAFQEIGLSDRLFASLSGGQAVAPAGVGKPNSDLSAFKRSFAGVCFIGKMAGWGRCSRSKGVAAGLIRRKAGFRRPFRSPSGSALSG
jgi:hypothetical protein